MAWRQAVNRSLHRTVGYELVRTGGNLRGRPRHAADRLVPSPVFVLSPVRSGSTLLRVLLDTHSQICAPHELHLRRLRVKIERAYAELAVETSGLDVQELEHLLWDRLLDRELMRSGKQLIVDKTPSNVLIWWRLHRAWPAARFVFLLRHPAAVADSWARAHPTWNEEEVDAEVLEYMDALEQARAVLPGPVVRYERLTTDTAAVLAELCRFLRVPFEPGMLDYGAADHGPLKPGLGDWSTKIRSGTVQPADALPTEVRASLRPIAQAWGYLEQAPA